MKANYLLNIRCEMKCLFFRVSTASKCNKNVTDFFSKYINAIITYVLSTLIVTWAYQLIVDCFIV